ncbi:MAG: hypothetical protein AAFX05_01080 [Planctomycetota bacterium]
MKTRLPLLALASVLAGCGGSTQTTTSPTSTAVNEPAPAGPSPEDPWSEQQNRMSLYEQALKNSDFSLDPPDEPRTPRTSAAIEATPPQTNLGPTYDVESEQIATQRPTTQAAATDVQTPPPSLPDAPASPSRADRITRLTGELAGQVRLETDTLGFLLPGYLKVAALDAIVPGTLNSHYIGVDDGAGATTLSKPEHAFVVAWRDMHAAVWQNADSGDIEHLAAIVTEHAEHIADLQPLTIADARLCLRVEGFGVFTELRSFEGESAGTPTYKLLTGRRHKLIVYVELDNFTHAPASRDGVSGYEVELTQSLSLHHLGKDGDLVAWRMDEQVIQDFSRRQRNDFFVVQIIELPEVLSVDRYNLKVRVTDAHSSAQAESIIRIDLVADTSAFVED